VTLTFAPENGVTFEHLSGKKNDEGNALSCYDIDEMMIP
jgi:hypothetical protein